MMEEQQAAPLQQTAPSSAPMQMRYYWRRATMQDVRAGVKPVQLAVGPIVNGEQATDLFVPPLLQYRYKERVFVDGKPVMGWSPWCDVPQVRDGDVEQ